jgi:hypothetical protein
MFVKIESDLGIPGSAWVHNQTNSMKCDFMDTQILYPQTACLLASKFLHSKQIWQWQSMAPFFYLEYKADCPIKHVFPISKLHFPYMLHVRYVYQQWTPKKVTHNVGPRQLCLSWF